MAYEVPDINAQKAESRLNNDAELVRNLSQTDWIIIRAADASSGKAVPPAVTDERAAFRATHATREVEIG